MNIIDTLPGLLTLYDSALIMPCIVQLVSYAVSSLIEFSETQPVIEPVLQEDPSE